MVQGEWGKRAPLLAVVVGIALTALGAEAFAQDLEPRSYANTPTGMNFLIAGYGYTTGGVAFDPALPLQNADLQTYGAILGYGRSLDLWGLSGKAAVVVPYGWASGSADVAGRSQERTVSGFGDPLFRFSVNPESGVTAAEGKAPGTPTARDAPTHGLGMKATSEVAFIPRPAMTFPAAADVVRSASLDSIHAGFRFILLWTYPFSHEQRRHFDWFAFGSYPAACRGTGVQGLPWGPYPLIAAYVAGLAVQVGFREAGSHSTEFTEGWGQLFDLYIFFLFGLIVTLTFGRLTLVHVLYAILSLTVVRMLPVAIALLGAHLSAATVLFMGWFGPRGLASIVLGLVFLEEQSRLPGEETIKLAVMVTVIISIFAHGLSALPGIDQYARRVAALDSQTPERRS